MNEVSENQVVADLAKASCEPQTVTVEGPGGEKAVIVAFPRGMEKVDVSREFEEFVGHPRRAKGHTVVRTVDSFCDLVARKTAETPTLSPIVYFNEDKAVFLAVLNDHGTEPGFRDYTVNFSPSFSDEWLAWTAASGKGMSQTDFAFFLEERGLDVTDASLVSDKARKTLADMGIQAATPATLQQLARKFSLTVKQSVKEARCLASGETQILFSSEHQGEDGRPLTVPNGFLIAIPIFKNGPMYVMIARLRYRLSDQKVTWFYQLEQVDKNKRDALSDMVKTIRERLSYLPFIEAFI